MAEIRLQQRTADHFQVAPGVWGMKDIFVNVYMVLNPFDGSWVLIDTGLYRSARGIKKMARQLFGDSKPSAIILTHGHFDHRGSLQQLLNEWNVPVYAHYLEIPYLTGKSSYPPGDPTAGGGLMSLMSWAYPRGPVNIWSRINTLPENGGVPGLPQWKYIHTPGHTPGHISLYRENDGVLIAGDAFVTVRAESLIDIILQRKRISGPPKYFTPDWPRARRSVMELAKLEPEVVATGHGMPMRGHAMRKMLHDLSDRFYEIAVPSSGRYVNEPAVADATGTLYIPQTNFNTRNMIVKSLAFIAMAAAAYVLFNKQKETKKIREALAYEVW